MRKNALLIAVLSSLALAACTTTTAPQPGPGTGEPKDECPDAHGNPCK